MVEHKKDEVCMDCDEPITKKQYDMVGVCEKCMYKSARPKKTKMRRKVNYDEN